MKGNINILLAVIWWMLAGTTSSAQTVNVTSLPLYHKSAVRNKSGDWLIKKTKSKSEIYRTDEGYIAFSNGLITRTFSVAPNGATIAVENLSTNESLLRAVSPEAVLWINGQEIKVGGLTGQPIGNYLLDKWIHGMKADPLSMKLVSFRSNPIKERFEWNRRTSWSPTQLPWPPAGKELVFTYKADSTIIQKMYSANASDKERKLIWKDDFLEVSPKWKIVTGTGSNISFNNEGKAGEILAPASSVAFVEQAIPQGAKVIICKVYSGTDAVDNSPYHDYGIGAGLCFANGKTSKVYIEPNQKRLTVNHDDRRLYMAPCDPAKSVWIRMVIMDDKIICSQSKDGETYSNEMELPITAKPVAFRVGKMDTKGGQTEGNSNGSMKRSKIEQVLLLGEPEKPGLNLKFLANLEVNVHYEMYDGIPLMSKWVSIKNNSKDELLINNIKSEQLALAEVESDPSEKEWRKPPVFTETDYAFNGMSTKANAHTVSWQTDRSYTTQVNYGLSNPCVLQCKPERGFNQELAPGQAFEGIRIWEMLFDTNDRERRGLAQRKLYRTIAPWITENPIIMHVSSSDDKSVKAAIDQCADVGFEMVIMTFGSGFNIEDSSSANLERMKNLQAYASSKKIALGGYSLLASRSIDKKNDVVMPNEKIKPVFSKSPCLQSEWGQNYFNELYAFYTKTGQGLLEHDGSYPGDVCASTEHPGHKGLDDSQWKQFVEIRDFYRWCRGKGIYLNIPDWYFLNGSSKTGMGYRETNWSLAREYQEIIERQNIYDGTWEKTPSMGWMFVPLVQYHGGGAEATIEPLKEHLPHYEQRLANLFGAGVQACYRGPRLYDSPETFTLVKKWADFYKTHRAVLDGDIIHIRRADGRDYDGILHVNPFGQEKGLLMIYNPLDESITREIEVDLYYTGLKNIANMSVNGVTPKSIKLNGTKARLKFSIPAKSQSWFVFTSSNSIN